MVNIERITINLQLDGELKEKLRDAAAKKGLNMSSLVRMVMLDYLKSDKSNGA